MEFPFHLNLDLGDGWIAGAVSGVLVIAPDPVCNPAELEPDWTVSDVLLDVTRVHGPAGSRVLETSRTEIEADHWLHEALLRALIEAFRAQIDSAWSEHIRSKLEHARRGFRPHADPSI